MTTGLSAPGRARSANNGIYPEVIGGPGHRLRSMTPDHTEARTPMIYPDVLKVAAGGTSSPLDALAAVSAPPTCTEPLLAIYA